MSESDEVKSIIDGSGNSFHCRVTNYLQEKGWTTLVSPYYMDSSSNKPREIDLIAEKAWKYHNQWTSTYGTVNIKLFIECKYIPQTNVFWFSEKDTLSTKNWVNKNTPLRDNNMFTQQHHYLSSDHKVAKLFASKNKPNVENEVIYKALNQSLNAMVYLRHKASIIPDIPNRKNDILATVELPVILCNSFEKFHRVEMEDSSSPEVIKDNFLLEVNYAYVDQNKNNRNDYFLIDVVSFEKFDDFLNQIESDKDAIFQVIGD
jgi:hypothetical protein